MTTKKYFPTPDDEKYIFLGNFEQVPGNVSYLAAFANENSALSDIGFKWHKKTQHLIIDNYQPPSYYDDYVMTASYSKKMQSLQKSQMERLVGFHKEMCSSLESFVEIGCGDGSFLKYAQNYTNRVLGIEPSRIFSEEVSKLGFDVINGYVNSGTLLTTEKFDAFVSRQVFEHLPDPLDVLTGIKKLLNPNAVGLIEVPNGKRSLRLSMFYDFFPDHVNYYSVNSLVSLATAAGFNVIECKESFESHYLELWLRNEVEIEVQFRNMLIQREAVCINFIDKISELVEQRKRIVIWGGGAKTLTILAASLGKEVLSIIGIIDSDPHKHGRYVPNSSILILGPENISSINPDVVFVLALSYRGEIADTVRQLIPTCELILTIDDFGAIVEL
tara:strand:- start:888 stop:2051 length:1164 start_codon:yes stop_codon:yes gene_type:complete